MKLTEIGLIPDDWEVKTLGDVCSFNNGVAHENYVDDNGEFILVNSKFISSDARILKYSKKQLFKVEENTILMVMSDVPNGKAIAKCFLVPPKFKGTLNQRICMFSEFKINREFVYRIINRNPYYLAFDDGIKQTNLRKKDVLNCPIAFPPTLAEQHRIAKALSDVDATISTTEKLIQKKKNIKQGTMQNLLTGKKRLPGFAKSNKTKMTELGEIPADWEMKKLGELGSFKNGISKPSEDFGFGYPFVNLMDIFGITRISEVSHLGLINSNIIEQNTYSLKEGDVLFVRSSVKPEGVGLTTVIKKDLDKTVYSGFILRFREVGNELTTDFKEYVFYNKDFRNSLISSSTVSANTNINQPALRELIIIYPFSKEEQNAIANVLSSMDKEIETLNTKLEKYRNIKTAMMQQLLTGKIRLVK